MPPPPRLLLAARTLAHHLTKHVGVGIVCSVAYFDPGNWSVDLQAGSSFGYRPMLFVVLLAGLGAMVLQTLACKLGCVTGLDLASHCRLLLHDHPRHPRLVRRLVLYPLYALSEIAIISTDLAELIGSAIGLSLIFPSIPLWAGVLITSADVLVFLAIGDPSRSQGRPARLFELSILALVLAVFACFVVLLVRVKPDWPAAFLGFVPNKDLFQSRPDAVYTAVGILGATVMPHALFLGSFLATQDRVAPPPPPPLPAPPAPRRSLRARAIELFRPARADRAASATDFRTPHATRVNNSLPFVHAHLAHGIADVVSSLAALAIPINSAILILAAAVFFARADARSAASLFDAHDLIRADIGRGPAFVFALALLCAGQTSSVTATFAGQLVSEGFVEWRVSPFARRLATRLLGLAPAAAVAAAAGRAGLSTLLVASQVVLAVVLPFVALPLIYLTSSRAVMRVRAEPDADDAEKPPVDAKEGDAAPAEAWVDYSNGRVLTAVSYAIWVVVVMANTYAIVMLGRGTQ